MNNAKSYNLGHLATISISVVEDKKDKLKSIFKYEIDYLKPEARLTQAVANKIAALTFLYIQSHGNVSGEDIADSLSTNKLCRWDSKAGAYVITSEGVNKDLRALNPLWKEIIKHPESQTTGWIIEGLIEISDLSSEKSLNTCEAQQLINCDTIKATGKYWYETSKKIGSRFEKLIPKHEIIPLAIYVNSEKTDEQEQDVLGAISSTSDHFYLYGEGGIGKTTALFCIMKNAYNPNPDEKQTIKQTPLFIELSQAYDPDDFANGRSRFIEHTIQRQIQDSLNKMIDLEQIEELMSNRKGKEPEFVFLLDGLNEVSRDELNDRSIVTMVIAEIQHIISNWKNTRIILTSRSNENPLNENIPSLELSGIKTENVEAYLKEAKFSEKRISAVTNNTKLMEILCIPLFLTLFANIKGEEELLTRGEILHAFFTQKKDSYSARNRLDDISKDRKKSGRPEANNSITPQMLCFMMDFIMPAIAWDMVRDNDYQVSRKSMKESIRQALSFYSASRYVNYIDGCFTEYYSTYKQDPIDIAEQIDEIFGKNKQDERRWLAISDSICNCLVNQLGILVTNKNNEYKVIHQHIRDYFAALYHINNLRLAVFINEEYANIDLARECLNEWIEDPLPSQVLTFIGEALGEVHNAPVFDASKQEWVNIVDYLDPRIDKERTLIRRTLEIFREQDGIFTNDPDNKDYSVWNLLQILKMVRDDLSGEDFSYLDLSNCELNGHYLGKEGAVAFFHGAKVTDRTFLPKGHGSVVNTAFHSPKTANYIVTASGDRTAKIWDAKTYQEKATLRGHTNALYSASYDSNEKYILTASRDGTARLWNSETLEEEDSFVYNSIVYSASFNSDGTKIAIALGDGTVRVWELDTRTEHKIELKAIERVNIPQSEYGEINTVRFSTGNTKRDRYIIASSNDCTARIVDVSSYKEIESCILFHNSKVLFAEFDQDGNRAVTACEDGSIHVWDTSDLTQISEFKSEMKHDRAVFYAVFNPEGDTIASASIDKKIKIWKWYSDSFKEFKTISPNKLSVNSIGFNNSGSKFIAAFGDHTFKVYDAYTFEDLTDGVEMGQVDAVYSAEFNTEADSVVTALSNDYVELWEKDSKGYFTIVTRFKGHNSSAYSATFNRQGNLIASSASDRRIIIRDILSDRIIVKELAHKGAINSVQWDPVKSNRLVSASSDGTVKIWEVNWDTMDLEQIGKPLVHGNPVTSASYSKDGSMIVTASGYIPSIWNIETETPKRITKNNMRHQKLVSRAIFSDDSRHILTCSGENSVKEWNAVSGNYELENEYKMSSVVNDAQYFGDFIIAASADGTVKIWDHSDPKKDRILFPTQIGGIHTVRVSNDLHYIVTSSDDGVALVREVKNTVINNVIDHLQIEWTDTIGSIPGILVNGVDLGFLSEESHLSDTVKGYLKTNGAILEHYSKTLKKRL